MIARIWQGITPAAKAGAYLNFLIESGVPDYQATPVNRGAYVLRRLQGDRDHFLTLTFWDSLESIAAFAEGEVEKAKYYPQDKDYLLEFEPTVEDYEVLIRPV